MITQDSDAKSIIQEHRSLQSQRQHWEPLWEECRVLGGMGGNSIYDTTRNPGQKNNQNLYDDTAQNALGKLTNGIISMVCPDGDYYHGLEAEDDSLKDNSEAQRWFDEENKALFSDRYAASAMFGANNFQTIEGGCGFGTAGTFVDENPDGGFLYSHIPTWQLFLSDDAYGRPSIIQRKFQLPAHAILKKYREKTPEAVMKVVEKEPLRMFWLIHCVRDNDEYDPKKSDYRGMKLASYLVLLDGETTIERGGYFTQPFALLRYNRSQGEVYGRSPLMKVLGSARLLQGMKRDHMNKSEQALNPTLLAAGDGTFSKISMKPNSIVHGALNSRGEALIKAFDTGGLPQLAEALIEREQDNVADGMFVKMLTQIANSPDMNQMQVLEVVKERATQLGPAFGTWQQQYFDALTARELDIRARQGRQVPLPEVLHNKNYKIKYAAPINRALKAGEASKVMQTLQAVAPIMQLYPEARHHINGVLALRKVAESMGAREILNDEDVAAQQAQQEQQQAMMAQAAQAAPMVAKAAKDAAEAEAVSGAPAGA